MTNEIVGLSEMNGMCYYGFSNMYLSSMQVGIQNAHCLMRMSREYGFGLTQTQQGFMFREWANDHETMICLNGGNQAALIKIRGYFNTERNPYAWMDFYEDEQSLNNCLTCVGIILPERIYGMASMIRKDRTGDLLHIIQAGAGNYSEWEIALIELLNQSNLAH